ncbi:hypothetical protein ACN4EG_23575 [Alkalinema pantanalense CENA528]|uniref:hypothetical protein n=1 Tax=Alkalinema pantanalense TaxID=1620705 RepID=UPI003D6DB665
MSAVQMGMGQRLREQWREQLQEDLQKGARSSGQLGEQDGLRPGSRSLTRSLQQSLQHLVQQRLQRPWFAVLIMGSLVLNGCSVEKARSLQNAASQFRNESSAAIDAIDTLRKRELEAPPRSAAEIRQSFINRLLNSKSELNSTLIELAIDPYQPPQVTEWDEFITDLRGQYDGFAAIFDQLEGGTIVGTSEVRKSAEYARTLTVQMALFADALNKNPPVLTQYRASVIIKLKKLRQDYQALMVKLKAREQDPYSGSESLQLLNQQKSDMENRAGELMGEWQSVKQEEKRLLETTVTQCMKAVVMGKELIEIANRYDEINLNQLNAAIPRILTNASALTGRNYDVVKQRSTRILNELQTDPFWSGVTRTMLDRVNNVNRTRSTVPNN